MKALREKRFLMEGASAGAIGARIQYTGFKVDLDTPREFAPLTPPGVGAARK